MSGTSEYDLYELFISQNEEDLVFIMPSLDGDSEYCDSVDLIIRGKCITLYNDGTYSISEGCYAPENYFDRSEGD